MEAYTATNHATRPYREESRGSMGQRGEDETEADDEEVPKVDTTINHARRWQMD